MRLGFRSRAFPAVLSLAVFATTAAVAKDNAAPATPWRSIAESYAQQPAAAAPANAEGWLKTLNEASRTWVRRLPVSANRLKLQGEQAVRKVPIYFSAADAARATELRVGAVTSVAALDNASALEVYLNGVMLGSMPPRFDAPAERTFALQPGSLLEGFNEVKFVARHQHRIDCTVGGSFELWTEIVPALTGIVGNDTADVAPTVGNLASFVGRNDEPTTLRVRLPRTLDELSAARIVRLVNALVLDGWIADPHVVIEAAGAAPAPGIGVAIAATPPPAAEGGKVQSFADVPALYVARGPKGETTGLVLAGDGETLDSALDALEARARGRVPTGSTLGVQTLVNSFGHQLEDASSMTLASLGIDGEEFRGRRFRLDIPTLLPGDFYQADYGNMLLYLDGGYPGGLVPGSLLKIKVNDVDTVTLPLDDRRPTTFDGREIRIPLGMFHAGMNTLTIEAELVTENDALCAPESAPVMTPRFELSDTTRIVVPRMARVGAAPNLSATFSHGYPYLLEAAPTRVFVGGDPEAGFGTAVSLLADITANAQRTKHYDVAFRVPGEAEDGILVGPVAAMPAWAVQLLGQRLSPEDDQREDKTDGRTPVSDSGRAPVLFAALNDTANATDASADAFARRIDGSERETAAPDIRSALGAAVSEARRLVSSIDLSAWSEQFDRVAALFVGSSERENKRRTFVPGDVVFAQAARSDLQGFNAFAAAVIPHAPPRTWTVVAADTPAVLQAALDGVSDKGVRFNPSGQYYVYGEARDKTIAANSDGVLYATRTPGPVNLRLVAAGWISKHVRVYVLIIIPLTLMLGVMTFVAARRRRSGKA